MCAAIYESGLLTDGFLSAEKMCFPLKQGMEVKYLRFAFILLMTTCL